LAFLLKWKQLQFHIIFGNHDYEHEQHTSFELLKFIHELGAIEHVHVYTKPTKTKIEGHNFQFLPWPHHTRLEGRPSVIIAHVTINGTVLNSGYKSKSKVDVDPQDDLWVVGDIHQRCEPKKYFIHPGTPYQTRFDETLPKGFTVFSTRYSTKQSRIAYKQKFIPITTPFKLINKFPIESTADLEKLETGPTTLYKLLVSDGVKLPSNFAAKYPNVLDSPYVSSKQKQLFTDDESFKTFIDGKSAAKSLTFGLSTFLQAKGFNEKQTKLAKRIIRKLLEQLAA
jgi:hypothetical protein